MKRSVIQDVGPWRGYKEIYEPPSFDWLGRAWKAGKDIRIAPHLTVVEIGLRSNNYVDRPEDEHRAIYRLMKDNSGFRKRELVDLLFHQERWLTERRFHTLFYVSTGLLLRTLIKRR